MNEEVGKALVQGHQNDLVVLRNQLFHHFDRLGVDIQTLDAVAHELVEVPEEGASASQGDTAPHLI